MLLTQIMFFTCMLVFPVRGFGLESSLIGGGKVFLKQEVVTLRAEIKIVPHHVYWYSYLITDFFFFFFSKMVITLNTILVETLDMHTQSWN